MPATASLFTDSSLHESTPSSAAGAAAEMEEAPAGAGSGPAGGQAEVAEEAPVGVPGHFPTHNTTIVPFPVGDEANSSPQKHGAVASQDRSGEAAQGGRRPRPVGGGEDAADAEGQRQSSGEGRRADGGEVRREPCCIPRSPLMALAPRPLPVRAIDS